MNELMVCPEGFRPLTEAEREKLNTLGEGESLFLTNEEDHIAVSIGWKDVNAFAGFLLHLISPISSVEASVNRAMAPYGYRKETMLERQIGGQIAKGFRYTYTAGNTPMVGDWTRCRGCKVPQRRIEQAKAADFGPLLFCTFGQFFRWSLVRRPSGVSM